MSPGSTNNFLFYCIFLVFLSFSVSSIIIPYVKKFGRKFEFLDNINSRNLNNIPIVRIGGLGIFLGYSVALFFILKIILAH